MNICPECRSVYTQSSLQRCERDDAPLFPVQFVQDTRKYPLINQTIDGRYLLIGGIGQGGLGTVYLARHILLEQLCAIKFLDLDMLMQVDEEQRKESLQDFMREARIATVIQHESVVRVSDYGIYDKNPFLVMDYIPGPSLLKKMKEKGKFPIPQALAFIQAIALALDAFHKRKLVHRDLKPANVILDPRENGRLTLVDLGLVKDLSNASRSSTHPLALRGTPGYLAPEQVPGWVLSTAGVTLSAEKKQADARVDIYALGVLAYELISGNPPYPKGLSANKIIVFSCTQDATTIEELCPEIEDFPGLAALIRQMMDRDLNQRPKSGAEVFHQIEEILQDHSSEDSPKKIRDEILKAQANLMQQLPKTTSQHPAIQSHITSPSPIPIIPKPINPKFSSTLVPAPKNATIQASHVHPQISASDLETQDFSMDLSGHTEIADQSISEDIFESASSQSKTAIQDNSDQFIHHDKRIKPVTPKNQLVTMPLINTPSKSQAMYQNQRVEVSNYQDLQSADESQLISNENKDPFKIKYFLLFFVLAIAAIMYFSTQKNQQKTIVLSNSLQEYQSNIQSKNTDPPSFKPTTTEPSIPQTNTVPNELPVLKIIEDNQKEKTTKTTKTTKTVKQDKPEKHKNNDTVEPPVQNDPPEYTPPKPPKILSDKQLDDLFEKGIQALQENRNSEALNYFNQFLDKAPKTHRNYTRAITYRDGVGVK